MSGNEIRDYLLLIDGIFGYDVSDMMLAEVARSEAVGDRSRPPAERGK